METVFARLAEFGLQIKPEKCKFAMREINLLGYVLNEKGIKANPEKTVAISKMPPPPKTVKQVRPGDTVVLLAPEPVTLTSKWDPHWIVTRVANTTVFLRHQQSGHTKKVHRSKVRLVDPDMVWDEVSPRPRRKQHRGGLQVTVNIPVDTPNTTDATPPEGVPHPGTLGDPPQETPPLNNGLTCHPRDSTASQNEANPSRPISMEREPKRGEMASHKRLRSPDNSLA